MNDFIKATYVCQVGQPPTPPADMLPVHGRVPEGRLAGSNHENLCEVAGRVCYDSLASTKARNTSEYHRNIREVGHLSVIEHAYFTVRVTPPSVIEALGVPVACLNRPSLYFTWEGPNAGTCRITLNLRHVLEWLDSPLGLRTPISRVLNFLLKQEAHKLAPKIVTDRDVQQAAEAIGYVDEAWKCEAVQPQVPAERFHSLFLASSRGVSHEWVRHKAYSAISQRSTRFVDESASPWIHHPLVLAHLDCAGNGTDSFDEFIITPARQCYDAVVKSLQEWLTANGVDKFTARKQSRGAARGYLGNALLTEMVYTASEIQWEHILRMRATIHADAEIRELAVKAWNELAPHSPYLAALFKTLPSPDGIGKVLECVSE